MNQLQHLLRTIPTELAPKKADLDSLVNLSVHFTRLIMVASVLVLLASCEKNGDAVIDSVGSTPQLTQVSISPSRINSDSINVGSSRQPDDLITITSTILAIVQTDSKLPLSVNYSISSSDSLTIVSQGNLLDDGVVPDQTKGDGRYSALASFQIRRVQVGTYVVQVDAESSDGYRSNDVLLPLTVFRGNRPPVISDLSAPDSVKLGSQSQLISLAVRAADPDGLKDVARVVFNSFKPDSSASGGNPFLMYDDGLAIHGDEKAGDGIFSLVISLPSNTQIGTYRFEFQAFDRSNEPSNVIILRLTVRP